MIGKGRLRSIIAGLTVFVFSADLLVGTVLGSASRDRHQEFLGSVEVQNLRAEDELAIRLYRGTIITTQSTFDFWKFESYLLKASNTFRPQACVSATSD